VLFGDAGKVRERLPELLAVTAEDVRAAAERIFTPGNRVVLEYRPVQESETDEATADADTVEGN